MHYIVFKTKKGVRSIPFPILPFIILLVLVLIIVFSMLPPLSMGAYNDFYSGLHGAVTERKSSVTLKKPSDGVMKNAMYRILEGEPEIFYVDGISYSFYENDTVKVNFSYRYSASAYEADLTYFRSEIDRIVAQLEEDATNAEKARQAHDYIIENYSYGGDHDALSMLRTGKGVCSAYAALYKAILDRLGIENVYLHGKTEGNFGPLSYENHAWNLIKIGAWWYHVDVTWDDASGEEQDKYFMVGDIFMKQNYHKTWDAVDNYNYYCFWNA